MITVISSYARDVVRDGTRIEVREGGPARFITELLMRYQKPYELLTGDRITVQIDLSREESLVSSDARIAHTAIKTPVLVSTILREFDLPSLRVPYAVDIQGYVRDGTTLGGKKRLSEPALKSAWLVKGTRREFAFVDRRFLAPHATLLITDGSRGFEVQGTKRFYLKADRIDASDTIGAGDTLFASFALGLLDGMCPYDAARQAKKDTESFLTEQAIIR